MPANPGQIHAAIQLIGRGLASQLESERAAQQLARQWLQTCASQPDALRLRAEAVAASEPALRCALPLSENVAQGYSCSTSRQPHTIVAVDGSQSLPDRHAQVLLAMINVGAVTMEVGSGKAPSLDVDTQVIYGDDLYSQDGTLLSEGEIALRRDSSERGALLRHALTAAGPSISLIDGPLELWGPKGLADAGAFEAAREAYLRDLRELGRRGWMVAGYVDKPGAALVVRLLEIGTASGEDLKALRYYHPLGRASDRWLFGEILAAGERSAIFGLQSASRTRYTGSLSLHFFYLNVGAPGHPALARVEIPGWVAEDARKVEILHRALLEQCRVLGARAYPYVLHRAHETASLSPAEIEGIQLRLLLELRAGGIQPEASSAKSSAKRAATAKGRN